MAQAGIGWFTRQVFTRTSLDQLPVHLQHQYGIDATGVTELDVGVYRVRRPDGARDLRLVDAFVSRYRRHVSLTDAELAALPMAIAARPLTMSIWSLAVGRSTVSEATQDHQAVTQQAGEIAVCARRAFATN